MAMELFKRLARKTGGRNATAPFHWRSPTGLDRGALGGASLALDYQGHGIALWEKAGGIWSVPIGPGAAPALVRLPQGEGRDVSAAMNSEGKGLAVWSFPSERETHILGLELGPTAPSPTTIFRTAGRVQQLQVGVDRRGNGIVLWLHERGGQFEILTRAFDLRAESWEGQPIRLGPPSAKAMEPRLAMNQREEAVALWHFQTDDFDGLVASHYLSSTQTWSVGPVPIAAGRTTMHQLALDHAGNAQALWVHPTHAERSRLESAYFDSRTFEWSQPETLARALFFIAPKLAMAGSGEALAAWGQAEAAGPPRLFAKSSKNGRWETEVERLDPGNGQVLDFAIAMGSSGRAGLFSLHEGHEGYLPMFRWRDGEWSSPAEIGGISKAPLLDPRLALCPLGAVVLWTQEDGRNRTLYASVTERTEGRP